MPIVVKDYTWTQTPKMINIRFVVSPVYHEEVDIFTADSYVKVSFSPFIFEVFLLYEIDVEKSKGFVKEDIVILDLMKKEEREWETLEKELTKPEKMATKKEILEKCQEDAKQKAEDKRIKKSNLDRFTVQQAMDIDAKQHALMDARRNAEKDKAMNALETWRVETENKEVKATTWSPYYKQKSQVTITEITSEDEDENVSKNPENTEPKRPVVVHKTDIIKEDSVLDKVEIPVKPIPVSKIKIPPVRRPVKTPVKSDYVEKKKEEIEKRVLPRMRETAELVITHTPRTFPTPTRESAAEEEQAWLKNISLARRATGFVHEDLRPEEQDPQWCKEKGDEFFRNGNFLGAVSAYSHGITLSDKLPSLYANRSAVHFALGNFNKCLNDCSTALELMVPPCEGNRKSRAKCIARRAAALARVGYLNKAIDEMKAASKLLPDDENIKKDIYDMERAWEQNPDDN